MMNLEEAIKHCEEVAYEQDMKAGFETDNQTYTMSEVERERCKECANEHRQLAEWLKELKDYKDARVGCEYCKHNYREQHERPCSLCQRNFMDMFEREVNADDES